MKFLLIAIYLRIYASVCIHPIRLISSLGFFPNTFIPSSEFASDPVLIIPGMGESRLIDGSRNIWPPNIKDFVLRNNKWKYDMTKNPDIAVCEFGDIDAFDLNSIIPFFNNYLHTVVSDIDGRTIPYDFRKLNSDAYLIDFYTRLDAYIENMDCPVILLAHSVGGLLIHWFLYNKSASWKKKYIKRVIYVSVPFGGTLQMLQDMMKWSRLNNFIGLNMLSCMGGYSIYMPNSKCISPILTVDGVIKDDYLNFLNISDVKFSCNFNDDMIQSFSESNGVETYVVYGYGRITSTSISIAQGQVNIVYGDGDGVVSIESLRIPESWDKNRVETIHIYQAGHSSILTSPEFDTFLKKHI